MKTGWGLGVTITACVLAFGLYRFLETLFPRFREKPFKNQENYTMSSAASAAGFMSSAGLVSAFPALTLTTGRELTWWELTTWLGCVSILGVFMAVPLKRQLINLEQLPFPSGIATAETLKSMHSEGSEAVRKARSLMIAGLIGGLVKISHEGIPLLMKIKSLPKDLGNFLGYLRLPETFPLIPFGFGEGWKRAKDMLGEYTIGFEGSAIMLAAGAIMGIRVGTSMLVGSFFFYGTLAPILLHHGIIRESGYRGIVYWTVWPATSMMVVASLLSFMFRWRTIFQGIVGTFRPQVRRSGTDHLEDIEVPMSWFLLGTFIPGTGCVILGHFFFDIRWDMGILAVLVTFILSVVAARATGETDITPIGAMGKITQLLYGVIAPSRITTNLMTASITSGAASHAADLLTDLKTGYLLGGNPRKQTISQLFGVLAGTVFCVPIYLLVVKKDKIGSAEMPFPSAKVWESVARLMNEGVQNLPQGALQA
ncbi:MAG: OPT/YSL family transporter, partial [Planctomycetaceae bacterium]|nr:OPT/YSL family transporter [Planctomycetaceae bacterium]